MARTTIRRSLLAMASVTAGVTSVAAAPAVASAEETAQDPSPLSHGACNAVTTVAQSGNSTVRLPTIGVGGTGHCIMSRGMINPGVGALQSAINRCYPAFSGGVGRDNNYGPNTERAVKQIQDLHNIGVDGVYGPQTKNAMQWPHFDTEGFDGCRRLG